jgi:hypothetical protein
MLPPRVRPLVALLPFLLSACYSYARAPAGARLGGGPVRVTLVGEALPDSARGALAAQVGPSAAVLEGRAAAAPANGWLALAVTQVTRANGVDEFWRGERVRVPVGALARVEVRRFDRRRTAALVAGVAGGVLFARSLRGSGATFSGGGRPTTPGSGGK